MVLGGFDSLNNFLSFKPSEGTSLGESASFEVKIRPQDDKKKGKGRKGKVHKVTAGLYFSSRPRYDRFPEKVARLPGSTI